VSLVHWDDVEGGDLGTAAGARFAGVTRAWIEPGGEHRHGGGEQLVYALGGDGRSGQDEIRAGDALLQTDTVVAGAGGLDLLAFGLRTGQREAAPPRPPAIATVAEIEGMRTQPGRTDVVRRNVGGALGALTTGMRHIAIAPGAESYPPHCHSAEEELFVMLEGDGVLRLGDDEHAVRAGHVVARPAGTGVAHSFVAGDDGLAMLAWGTNDPRDLCWYPRSRKVLITGLNLVFRPEPLDFWDGEA